MRSIVFAVAASLAAPAMAVPVVAPPAAPSGADAAIATIMDVTFRQDTLIASVVAGFDAGFKAKVESDPRFQAMAARDPGFEVAVENAVRGDVTAIFQGGFPELREKIRTFYAARFTPAELKTLADFYTSPTGHRMIAGAAQGARDAALARVKAGATGANPADMTAVNNGASAGAMQQVQADDMPVLMAFSATPAAQKAKVATPELQQLVIGWSQQLVLANRDRIAAASKAAIAAYQKAHPAKPG